MILYSIKRVTPSFKVAYKNEFLYEFQLSIPGLHNIENALAAIAISRNAGIESEVIAQSLMEFTGTRRRFDIRGKYDDITVVDDYAHHPTEIKATLEAAKQFPP